MIDLSQGTPVDPTPQAIQIALQSASNAPGYPLTTGSEELRGAIKKYCRDILGAQGDFDVLPTIGSKELVASLAYLLQRSKVFIPKIAYPTYKVGALLAHAQITEVDINPQSWPASDEKTLIWVNTPSNPTGYVHTIEEMEAALAKRASGALLVSDECYFSFPDSKNPISFLSAAQGDFTRLITVHSLSKRSNIAGYRSAFIAGDPELIGELLQLRKHAGEIMPAPIQRATVTALADEEHVRQQAERYRVRRSRAIPALIKAGFKIEHSQAGLYIWCSNGFSDWEQVSWFSERGIIVTPGSFYGEQGAKNIRIAITATDQNITKFIERIS